MGITGFRVLPFAPQWLLIKVKFSGSINAFRFGIDLFRRYGNQHDARTTVVLPHAPVTEHLHPVTFPTRDWPMAVSVHHHLGNRVGLHRF